MVQVEERAAEDIIRQLIMGIGEEKISRRNRRKFIKKKKICEGMSGRINTKTIY